jgi:hypothetical protein
METGSEETGLEWESKGKAANRNTKATDTVRIEFLGNGIA